MSREDNTHVTEKATGRLLGKAKPVTRVASATLRGAEGRVVRLFRAKSADSPKSAIKDLALGLVERDDAAFRRLLRARVIREATQDDGPDVDVPVYYLDEASLTKHRQARKGKGVVAVVILLHLVGTAFATYLIASHERAGWSTRSAVAGGRLVDFFKTLELSGKEFFSQLFISGAFLYTLLLALRHFGLIGRSYGQATVGAAALSVAIAILAASDADRASATLQTARPTTAFGVLYLLATERRAMFLLGLLAASGAVIGTYYILRSLVKVEYQGAGIQIRLPGQSVTHLPIFPQISWQNTGITLKEGERISVDIYGWVSPGTYQNLDELQDHMKEWLSAKSQGSSAQASIKVREVATWPYTTPAGYPEEWYDPERMLPVLKKNLDYCRAFFFREDDGLTVRGLPHNIVLGMIQSPSDRPPIRAKFGQPAYNYSKPEDQEKLLYLSSDRYPITFEAPKSGDLWVVINDVDEARWDNGGMFFMKIMRHAWL